MKFLLPVLALCLIFGGCTSKDDLNNKIVLDVNGDRWTAEDFSKELVFRLRDEDALMAKNPAHLKDIKKLITQDFIIQSLSAQWARKNGLIVKAEDLNGEIEKVKKSYPDDLAFKAALAEQGLTFKGWKARMEQTMIQKLIVKKLGESLEPPSAATLQAYYKEHVGEFSRKERVKIRQVLLPLKRDATLIEDQMKKGLSLEKLASVLNADGEHLQPEVFWVEKGESPIFDPAFKMAVGRRSSVIKSSFGFHIFEVLAKQYARDLPLKEVKDDITRRLMEDKQQEAYSKWLDEQVRKARIYKNQELIDGLRIETKEY
jgi:peptidyl-prolyl cis-trans isomerase C